MLSLFVFGLCLMLLMHCAEVIFLSWSLHGPPSYLSLPPYTCPPSLRDLWPSLEVP